MSTSLDERLARIEDRLLLLQKRLDRLEGRQETAPAEPTPAPQLTVPAPTAPPTRAPARPAAQRREIDLEELLGGRVLALVGGLAVIVGLAFLVALAIEHGWLDERGRTALAFVGSGSLLALGAWLYERRGRTQAALAACGTGLAGLFLSLTAATVLYDLVPAGVALAAAFVFGALGAWLAIRWDATPIGGLGILGALGAPILTGATQDAQALLFLAVAGCAAVAVLVWRRWEWLRVGAIALILFQLSWWVFDAEPSRPLGLTVLALFGLLGIAAALGFELRRRAGKGARSTFVLLLGNAIAIAWLGAVVAYGQEGGKSTVTAGWWLAGLAIGYAALGLGLLRVQPRNRGPALCLLGIGLVLANIAFVVLVSGVAIPIGWAAAAVALGLPARTLSRRAKIVYAVVGAELGLAAIHVLAYDATPSAVAGHGNASIFPVLAIGASAFAVARLTPKEEVDWRAATDATALLAVAYAPAVPLSGVWLVCAWAFEGALLVEAGRRLRYPVAAAGALGFLFIGALHTLLFEARPDALIDGADPFWEAAVALAAVSALAALAAWRGLRLFDHDRVLLGTVAGTGLLYLVSIGIVSAFQPSAGTVQTGTLSVREQGQAILSALWSLVGLGLLWVGLRRDLRPLRLAGFALLAIVVGKVFLYDLATLDQGYRVLTFIVLGLFLLLGAYVYQRLRSGTSAAS
jgi:uncharacterized membrane protein